MVFTAWWSKPQSTTVVSPAAKQFFWAANKALFTCSVVGLGILLDTRSTALSTNKPVNFPFSVPISPPTKVWPGLIPAKSNAFWLAMAAWPSTRFKSTGWLGNKRVSSALLGKFLLFQSFWSQPRPKIQSSVFWLAKAFTLATISPQLLVPTKSTVFRPRP